MVGGAENPPGEQKLVVASCPEGTTAIGGGVYSTSDFAAQESVNTSAPSSDGSGWLGYADNRGATAHSISALAICAHVTSWTPPRAPGSLEKKR